MSCIIHLLTKKILKKSFKNNNFAGISLFCCFCLRHSGVLARLGVVVGGVVGDVVGVVVLGGLRSSRFQGQGPRLGLNTIG